MRQQSQVVFDLDQRQRIYNQVVKRLNYATETFISDFTIKILKADNNGMIQDPSLGDLLHRFSNQHSQMILDGLKKDLQLPATEQENESPQQPTILIIDDDEVSRRLLTQALKTGGYQIQEAENAPAGYLKVGLYQPSLILLDHEMPEVAGIEFAYRIKQDPAYATLPIIMVTSHRQEKLVRAARSVGISDFIVKPFQKEILLEKVSAILPLASP